MNLSVQIVQIDFVCRKSDLLAKSVLKEMSYFFGSQLNWKNRQTRGARENIPKCESSSERKVWIHFVSIQTTPMEFFFTF